MAIFAGIGATEDTALVQIGGSTGGGVGGVTVIPDGGTLSGDYQGNVLCEGEATVVGPVIVFGSLACENVLYNGGGHEFNVLGNLTANLVFIPDDETVPRGNINVVGDFFYALLVFTQCGGSSGTLRVGGDLIGVNGITGSPIYAPGLEDTSGANIVVYGDLKASYEIQLQGGDALTGNAGNGGSILVYGDFTFWGNLRGYGGDCDNGGFSAGNGSSIEVYGHMTVAENNSVQLYGGDSSSGASNSGSGGSIEVWGDLDLGQCTLDAYGGSAVNGGNGGNGGNLLVYGNLTTNGSVNLYADACNSNSYQDAVGSAGSLEVYGDVAGYGYFSLTGGYRTGNITSSGAINSPDGGNFQCYGNVTVYQIDSYGGQAEVYGGYICNGGRGGNVDVYGALNADYVYSYGGDSLGVGTGGNGATVSAKGITCFDLDVTGGESADNHNAGNGGEVYTLGSSYIEYVYGDGGDAASGNGGQGAYLSFDGILTVTGDVTANGGGCGSLDPLKVAGNGGYFDCYGLQGQGTLYLSAGYRYGGTTGAYNNSPPSAGQCYIYGSAVCDTIRLDGAIVDTSYPNGPGGNGGYLSVNGDLFAKNNVELRGGSSRGLDAGRGGEVVVQGKMHTTNFRVLGGSSLDSIAVGGDAAGAGRGGYASIRSGMVCYLVDMVDGSGSTPATGVTRLQISGDCRIVNLSMTGRPDCYIQPYSEVPATLKVEVMPTKNTLNNLTGVESNNISGSISDSIFFTGNSGDFWYVVTGTSIFPT